MKKLSLLWHSNLEKMDQGGVDIVFFLNFIYFILGRGREEKKNNTDLFFHLFIYSLVASYMYPGQE